MLTKSLSRSATGNVIHPPSLRRINRWRLLVRNPVCPASSQFCGRTFRLASFLSRFFVGGFEDERSVIQRSARSPAPVCPTVPVSAILVRILQRARKKLTHSLLAGACSITSNSSSKNTLSKPVVKT
jgi:hypothetical protein